MNSSETLKSLLILITLLIPTVCTALSTQQPKSTLEILKTLASSNHENRWVKITGIPEFDPKRHSDGCSGGMSATYAELKLLHPKYGKTLPWHQCCVVHDRAYYYGGAKKEKEVADEALKTCVSDIVGSEYLGLIMKDAVMVGGKPYFPTSYRWGYGEDFRGTENLPTR